MNPYEILGVGREASNDDIRRAYRELAKKYHPDVNSDTRAVETITKINAAYELFTNPQKRDGYHNRIFFVDQDIEFEEDSLESHQEEYNGQRTQEDLEKAKRLGHYQARWYDIVRRLCYPIGIFSLLVIVDFFLPANVEFDYPLVGDQKAAAVRFGSAVVPYMKTNLHEFEIPSDVHRVYDYYAKEKKLICMEFTPLFNSLKRIGIDHSEYMLMYRAPGSIYSSLLLPVPYILLALCILLIRRKEYSKVLYSLSFLPVVMAMVFFVLMYCKHV